MFTGLIICTQLEGIDCQKGYGYALSRRAMYDISKIPKHLTFEYISTNYDSTGDGVVKLAFTDLQDKSNVINYLKNNNIKILVQ